MNLKFWHRQQSSGAEYVRRLVPMDAADKRQAELERDLALAGIREDHPVWQAVLLLVDECAQGALEGALAPNLTNEQRQFGAGAAANAEYVATLLRDARLLAAQRAAKVKQG
jgi:hypothetical protein